MEITIEQIMSWKPCPGWPREKIIEAIGGESIDVLDFCELQTVNAEDKLWLLLRPEIIPEKELRLLACDFADSVLDIFEKNYPNDNRPRCAIEISRKYAIRETIIEKLIAARDAARAAAWAAASDAAWDAAWAAVGAAASDAASDAAWAAASDAAWAAASDAAWAAASDAAWDAACDAAWDAAWNKFLSMTKKLIEVKNEKSN